MPGDGWSTLNAGLFHAVGLLFHIANSLLLYGLLRRLFQKPSAEEHRAIFACGLGAVLYGVHPVQVEAVAWVTGNNNLFCTFFVLLSLYTWLRFARPTEEETQSKSFGLLLQQLSISAHFWQTNRRCDPVTRFDFGLCAPCIVTSLKSAQRFRRLFLLVCFGPCMCDYHETIVIGRRLPNRSLGASFIAGDALAFYCGKLLVPYPLCVDYGHGQEIVWSSWWGYVTGFLPCHSGNSSLANEGRFGKMAFYCGSSFRRGCHPNAGIYPLLLSSYIYSCGQIYLYIFYWNFLCFVRIPTHEKPDFARGLEFRWDSHPALYGIIRDTGTKLAGHKDVCLAYGCGESQELAWTRRFGQCIDGRGRFERCGVYVSYSHMPFALTNRRPR